MAKPKYKGQARVCLFCYPYTIPDDYGKIDTVPTKLYSDFKALEDHYRDKHIIHA